LFCTISVFGVLFVKHLLNNWYADIKYLLTWYKRKVQCDSQSLTSCYMSHGRRTFDILHRDNKSIKSNYKHYDSHIILVFFCIIHVAVNICTCCIRTAQQTYFFFFSSNFPFQGDLFTQTVWCWCFRMHLMCC